MWFIVGYSPADSRVTRCSLSGAPVISWDTAWSSVGTTLPGGQMADVEKNKHGHQHGDRSVEVRVSAQLENLAVVRTVVAAIGTFEDLDFDSVSDLRLAGDEARTGHN